MTLTPAQLGPTRPAKLGTSKHDELTRQAQKWVSQTFYGEMLKQMRNSPFKSELFSGGRGGQAFGQLFDQQLCDRMSRGAGDKLVRNIVRRVEANAAYQKHQRDTTGESEKLNRADGGGATKVPSRNEGRFKDVKINVAPAFGT